MARPRGHHPATRAQNHTGPSAGWEPGPPSPADRGVETHGASPRVHALAARVRPVAHRGRQRPQPVAYALRREPLYPALVVVEVEIERGEEGRGEVLEVEPGFQLPVAGRHPQEPEHSRTTPVVGRVREALQPVTPAQRLVAAVEQVEVLLGEPDEAPEEEVQPLHRRPPRLAQERLAQEALVREAAVERALANARGPRHLFHGHVRDAPLLEERPGRAQDLLPVARRVPSLRLPGRLPPKVVEAPPDRVLRSR